MIARCKRQHRSSDFVAFLREIDGHVEPDLAVHVVLDNLSAHKSPTVQRWLARHPRLHFHSKTADEILAEMRRFGLRTQRVHGE